MAGKLFRASLIMMLSQEAEQKGDFYGKGADYRRLPWHWKGLC